MRYRLSFVCLFDSTVHFAIHLFWVCLLVLDSPSYFIPDYFWKMVSMRNVNQIPNCSLSFVDLIWKSIPWRIIESLMLILSCYEKNCSTYKYIYSAISGVSLVGTSSLFGYNPEFTLESQL